MRTPYPVVIMLLLASLAVVGCGKSASDRKTLGFTDNGTEIVVNPQSIRQMGNKTIVRQALIYSKEVIAQGEKTPSRSVVISNPVVAQDFVVAFDCSQRTFEYLDYKWHYRDGQTQHMGKKGSQAVFPNSPIEITMNYACMSSWRRWLFEQF
jgi:hypothetical protein